MSYMAIFVAICTFFSTGLGWLFAIRFKKKLHLIMWFSAWVLLSVVFFDIFPEIIKLINETKIPPINVMIALVSGFLIFHILEKTILIHHNHEWDYAKHRHPDVWIISVIALIWHSFMDWIWIWFWFGVSQTVWIMVAIAVISHDFIDWINTITLMLLNKNTPKKSKIFLLIDALAPVVWIFFSMILNVSPKFLVMYLWFFAGFLLYIWTSDILPEAHSEKSSMQVIWLTILGVIMIFFTTYFV